MMGMTHGGRAPRSVPLGPDPPNVFTRTGRFRAVMRMLDLHQCSFRHRGLIKPVPREHRLEYDKARSQKDAT